MNPTQQDALLLCRQIENYAPAFGFHIGLTGGCLYGEGDRKDIDLILYRHSGYKGEYDLSGLLDKLAAQGLAFEQANNNHTDYLDNKNETKTIYKSVYNGQPIDLFVIQYS